MKLVVTPWEGRSGRRDQVDQMARIVEEYQEQGLKLTLRQLYYQHVARGLIENSEREYKRIASLAVDARYAGLIDWDAIEDRTRRPTMPSEWFSVEQIVDAAVRQYEKDWWKGQPTRPEVWVEKEALAEVMRTAARKWHVVVVVNRGYSSASSMFENAQRIAERARNRQATQILYFGDHDPSGLDMIRDVRDRICEFVNALLDDDPGDSRDRAYVEVHPIALTMRQVEEYDPPPNPAKLTDSRAAWYVQKHGDSSWELDALNPKVLDSLVQSEIEACINDREAFDAVKEEQQEEIAGLRSYARGLRAGVEKKPETKPADMDLADEPDDPILYGAMLTTACPCDWCRAHADPEEPCGDRDGPYAGMVHKARVERAQRRLDAEDDVNVFDLPLPEEG